MYRMLSGEQRNKDYRWRCRGCEQMFTVRTGTQLLRRIRHGMGEVAPEKLTGTIEVDELYIGGRPRYKFVSKKGRGTSKTPVVAAVQRGGDVRFQMMTASPERLSASLWRRMQTSPVAQSLMSFPCIANLQSSSRVDTKL